MLWFWIDPHHRLPVQSVDQSMGLMEGLVRALMPTQRRAVRHRQSCGIVALSYRRPFGVRATWGLRRTRAVAEADTLLWINLREVASHPATRDLWTARDSSARCLVPATGWISATQQQSLAFLPCTQPVTFAGLQWDLNEGRDRRAHTFALLVTEQTSSRARGHALRPVVVAPHRCRDWLFGDGKTAVSIARDHCKFDVKPMKSDADDDIL